MSNSVGSTTAPKSMKFWSSYGRYTVQIPMGMDTITDMAGNNRLWPKSIKISFGKPSITSIEDKTLYPQAHGFYETSDPTIQNLLIQRLEQAKLSRQETGYILMEGQVKDILETVKSNYELVGGVQFDQKRSSLISQAKQLGVQPPDLDHGLEAYSNTQLEQKIKEKKDALTKVVPVEATELPEVKPMSEVAEIDNSTSSLTEASSALEENKIEIKVAKRRGRRPKVSNDKPVMQE